jgi:NTP pyrophosphatase (non-canonical NTP hydrolase)
MKDLINKIVNFVDERDWRQFHNTKDTAISLVLEATEYLEHFQWKNPEEIEQHLKNKKEEVAEELADVLHWVLLNAYYLDVDLEKTLEKKLEKNAKKYPVDKAKGKHTKYTDL